MIGKKINQLATELAPASTDLTIIGNPTTGVSKKITLAQLGAIFSGAVSFYTNYAAFPTPGTTDVIFCAKDTQKLYLWSGSAYVEVFPSQALLDTYQLRSEKGVSNGYASLDSSGKVPISQLPSSIMEYKGTWNAATNTPTLANGTGDTGDVYLCNAAGSVNFGAGAISFAVGDYVIYSGTIWQRSSGAVGTVTSVAASITGDAIGITGSPVTTSGTLAFAFGGNSTQYINGAGNLITFPSIISQAANLVTEVYNKTGATLTKGTIVYINGGQGNLPTITKAIATGDSTSAQTFGIVQADITNNNNGYVVIAGRLSDLDTQAYTEGTQLYLSSTTAGTWTSTKQYAPAHLVYVGIVVRAHPTQGVVEVKIQNGYELDELHNVSAQSPTNNDGIFYNSATSLWEKKSIATVLGYTPQAQLNGTGFVKASGTTISYDNSTYVTTDTFQTISASKTFGVGFSIASAGGTNQLTSFLNTNSIHSGSAGTNVFGFNNSNNIYFGKGLSNGGVITYNNSAVRFYALPDADGTIALVGGSGVGTVTSVGLSSATSGVTIGSTPITTSGTITLAIATASGSQQGLLSSTDWTTFNNKQSALTNPVTGTGTTNYIPKFTATSTIGNSIIQDASTYIDVAGYAFLRRGGKYLLLNPNYAGTTVYADISAEAGMGLSLSANGVTKQLYIDTSGNLGLGVTPSASWATGFRALQMTSGVALISHPTVPIAYLSANYLATDSGAVYISSNFASRFLVNGYSGGFSWDIAPSGTAGNAISFTQAMTLDASGNLGVGTTSPSTKLDVVGSDGIRTSTDQSTSAFIALAGSASEGRITVSSYGGYQPMTFYTGGSERMRITSSGELWIKSTSTTTGYEAAMDNSNTLFNIYGSRYGGTGKAITLWATGASESMRINYTNNILIGTTTDSGYKLDVSGTGRFTNTSDNNLRLNSTGRFTSLNFENNTTLKAQIFWDNTTAESYFYSGSGYMKMSNTGAATFSSSVTSQSLFQITPTTTTDNALYRATNAGGTAYIGLDSNSGGLVSQYALNLYHSGAYPIIFSTSGSERMRITSGGEILAGSTSAGLGFVSASKFGSYQPYTTDSNSTAISSQRTAGMFAVSGGDNSNNQGSYTSIVANVQYGASNNPGAIFRGYGNTTLAVQINYNGNITNTNNSYGAISDISLKENISDTTSKLAELLKVKVRNYNLIGDNKKQIGVIAQELETIFPSMIETNSEGLKSVKYSVFVPMLIKAIQELNDKIK